MNLLQNDELLDHLNSTLKNLQIIVNKHDFSFNFASKDGQFYLQDIAPVINLIIDDNLVSCSPTSLLSHSNECEEIRDVIGSGKRVYYRFKYDIKGIQDSQLFADFVITLYDQEEYISLQMFLVDETGSNLSLKLHSLAPVWIKDGLIYLNGKLPQPKDITFFEQGFQSWSYNRTRTYEEHYEEIEVDILARIHQNMDLLIPSKYRSESVTAITDRSSKSSIMLGFCTLKDNYSQIVMDPLSNTSELEFLACYSQFDGITISDLKKKPICSELLLVRFCKKNEGYTCLRKYAQVTGKKMQARVSKPRIGWCSWYYYYEDITNDELLANVEFFTKYPDLPLDTIQLDDGYFTAIGDFTDFNDKFPTGLAEFVQKVHSQKKLAGLWIAPFFAADNSKLLKIHPEWFIRSKVDNELLPVCYNWNHLEYALDLTIPEVEEHIKSLIHTIIDEWKFDFIKIDFVYASSVYQSKFSELGLTRAQIYRKGIELIRDSMNEKFLLGCGAPLGPSIGIVDAMRVSEDTKEIWDTGNNPVWGDPCLKYALLGTIYRSFMHRAFWVNDPDCLMVRDKNSDLTENEIKLQVTIFGLSGGQVLISDKMSELSIEKLSLIQKLIPPFSETAIPIDVLYNPL
ncbi:MAG: glycoside hydrolase family 36 protein, partial [Candidatus Hodarchaeales archaeon]